MLKTEKTEITAQSTYYGKSKGHLVFKHYVLNTVEMKKEKAG